MAQQAARIVRDEDVMGGEPRVAGRRISVRQLRDLVEEAGLSARTVADRYDLDVADVYHALAYYHEHPDEMAEVRRERREAIEAARERAAVTPEDFERAARSDSPEE